MVDVHARRCALQRRQMQTLGRVCRWVSLATCRVIPTHVVLCSFGRAEGAVVIVLKALDAAVRDDDKIYATASHSHAS
jgi:hypothetical protein